MEPENAAYVFSLSHNSCKNPTYSTILFLLENYHFFVFHQPKFTIQGNGVPIRGPRGPSGPRGRPGVSGIDGAPGYYGLPGLKGRRGDDCGVCQPGRNTIILHSNNSSYGVRFRSTGHQR